MAWAAKYQLLLVDTFFGWKERSRHRTALRHDACRQGEVEDILKQSGTEGVFVEPSRRDMSTRVAWITTEKEEGHTNYLEQACRGRGELGLITCGRSLGVRHNLQGSDRVQRQWVLQGAAMEWGANDAQLVLKSSSRR